MDSTPFSQSPQPARDNRSAAQRRYRKKEEEGFLQLRDALKEVAKDDPRTRQDILRRASCELRRLADENNLLLQQKALIEACNASRANYRCEHPQSPSSSVIYEDPVECWAHDRTNTAQIATRSDAARHRVLDAAMSPNATMPTAQDLKWFTQLYDATAAQDSSLFDSDPWAQQQLESGDFARRPHSGSGYYARCGNCQPGEWSG
ncbi:hypothetical protein DEU56DRAFT_281111 [Suillus clintonianus]|uniref:uncharacterized protein n=1 Tax=Suillus clintonianus TaxID=1904413 RepID=UPI001B85F8F3|nr:uncharacterized protein DEU56DRAFT_281111 [Suillus clintonianus]KAG2141047.1 hypothetical protein DEU56DRAFT_281111 [Suillus clintonianus]